MSNATAFFATSANSLNQSQTPRRLALLPAKDLQAVVKISVVVQTSQNSFTSDKYLFYWILWRFDVGFSA